MPGRARVIVPCAPHHTIQRGHNRKTVFVETDDFNYYSANLQEWKLRLGIKLYSFCLMTNDVHLVLEPPEDTASLSLLMKQLEARQTRRVNKLEGRSGTLWEGRYKISPIQRENYLLQCCRYVEQNPVKAKMVRSAAEYPWSSYRARAGLCTARWLDLEETYLALGRTSIERQRRYREFVEKAAHPEEEGLIRNAVSRNQLTGNAAFVDEIELRTGIRIEHRSRGRPKNKSVPIKKNVSAY